MRKKLLLKLFSHPYIIFINQVRFVCIFSTYNIANLKKRITKLNIEADY